MKYQSNISRILAIVLSIFILFPAIYATIWSGVNSPGFDLRYSSQVFQSLGGSEDPGWTLTFLNGLHRCVVAPPLFDNRAEGKVMANEHCWKCCTQHLSVSLRRCFCGNTGMSKSSVVVSHMITGHLAPLPTPHLSRRKMLSSKEIECLCSA